ncbi:MAG: D-alanine--D-alanine ligase [Alphaproteobacteria bacterium]
MTTTPPARKRIAVLLGGFNGEREVSLESGRQVLNAVRTLGHDVIEIDVQRDIAKLIQDLTPKPDMVVNLLHGTWGEDGHIQSILDILEIPYSFSDATSSALAMNKTLSKRVFQAAQLPVPEGVTIPVADAFDRKVMDFPYVIKPVNEGSSLGVYLVFEEKDIPSLPSDWAYGSEVMVETYIPGREISVAIMGDEAIGAMELAPKKGFYDYKAKYTDGVTDHFVPPRISDDALKEALDLGRRAAAALGCQGICRVDLRYDDTQPGKPGQFFVLEANTQPGMSPLSIVPEIAANSGISFENLVQWMIDNPVQKAA